MQLLGVWVTVTVCTEMDVMPVQTVALLEMEGNVGMVLFQL